VEHLQQQALVLETKVNNPETTLRPQTTRIIPRNLTIPPEHESLAFQSIARLGMSIFASTPFGICRTDMANDGRADNTAVVRVRRPPMGRREVRQPGILTRFYPGNAHV
jgi:hypothetical protein